MNPIHSFRSSELSVNTGVTSVDKDGCRAFFHDITKGFPSEYSSCDILYSEPSWLKGYDVFRARAGAEVCSPLFSDFPTGVLGIGSFQDYIESISEIIRMTKLPVVLICGKQSLKKFPSHTSELPAILNGYKETAYAWGLDISGYGAKTNEDLLGHLAGLYGCVGDFSCGYGIAGRIFKKNGKRFVMSDINEKCITYISEWLNG